MIVVEFALAGLASFLAFKLYRTRKERNQLQEVAYRDPLTGVMNRRLFMELAQKELDRIGRSRRPVALAIVDVDHFKRINDTYGHGVGDQVLCQIANRIESLMRKGDVVARLGGEEFVILMPGADLVAAKGCCERIRAGIAKMLPEASEMRGETISASFGVTMTMASDEEVESLLRGADASLYEAKRSGRNCVKGHA